MDMQLLSEAISTLMEEGQEAAFFQPAPWKRDAKSPWCFKEQSLHRSLWPRSSPGRARPWCGGCRSAPAGLGSQAPGLLRGGRPGVALCRSKTLLAKQWKQQEINLPELTQ